MSHKFFTPKLVKFLAVAAISLGLVFFNPAGIINPAKTIFLKAAYPFQKTFYLISKTVSGTFEFLGSISNLKKENERLLRENDSLAAEIASLRGAKKENELLKEQLKLTSQSQFDLESAFVIGRNPERLGNWIIIDKGSSSGISPGMPVIVSDGILVGKIEEVYSRSSKVNLLTDSTSAVNAVDLDTGAKGIIKGEYGLGIVMDMVSQTDVLNEGDMVITSGLGSNLPKGLLVGKIQEVRATGDKLFQQALVSPRLKYSKLEVVSVIKTGQN